MSAEIGAVSPRAQEHLAVHPLPADVVRLTAGFWERWQAENASASMPHALTWLRREGVVANFDDWTSGLHAGPCYTDSDLYKTMEALAWEVGRSGDEDRARDLKALTDAVAAAQLPDGYLNTYVQSGGSERWADLADGHELYCIGHLIQAAIADRRSAGGDQLLTVARRAADLVVSEFGTGRRSGIDGHEGIEIALVELYRETGERAYLDLAIELLSRRGRGTIRSDRGHGSEYYQDATPPLEQSEAVGHAVRATYLITALADVALETGDEAYLAAATAQWESVARGKWYVTGALGSRYEDESLGEPFELPPDRAYGESCAAIGFAMASWRLLLVTGDARYADAIERILHNALAASTDVRRTGFFYVNPLQRRVPATPADPLAASRRSEPPATRPPWFETACCPPNIMRTIATVHQWLATDDASGLQIHQYMSASIDARSTGLGALLVMDTDYPDDGTVTLKVLEATGAVAELALRIPPWARGWELTVNGVPVLAVVQRGYVQMTRAWRDGDEVRLHLPVRPRLTYSHPAVDALRGTVVIERGPVVYCIEGCDQGAGVDLSTVALDPGVSLHEDYAEIAGQLVPVVEFIGHAIDPGDWSTLWPGDDVRAARATVRVRAIPYRLWANRGPSPMRVHIPTVRSAWHHALQ